jgi:glycosyltransferase involved in cell wall biosynthesis
MSTFLANEFMKNHALMPAHTIIPGIDPMLYPAFDGQKDIDVMGAGSLIPLKQYKIFIRVVKAISIVRPTVKAVICGGGPEMADLAELVRDLGLEENIQFTDHCKQEEVLRLMQRSKIFLHPSAYEGFGMVCAEALFAAAHVISFIFPLTDRTPQWHVVKDENEMTATALMLLENRATPYDSILVQKMEASARQIMSLFANKTAVSA